jgi:hypothetical protein
MSIPFDFTPVLRQRDRHDGWSAEKQHAFIEALGEYGIVRAAAEKVGMNAASAYKLREAPDAQSFADAWDAALKTGMAQLVDIAMDRAINGVSVPKFYKGEQVGEGRWYDNRLLMFMMRQMLTRRFGPLAAEYDFVDDSLAAEKARAEANRESLAKAEELHDNLTELADHEVELPADERALSVEEFVLLCQKRDRLAILVDKLTPEDPVRAVDFFNSNPGNLVATRKLRKARAP